MKKIAFSALLGCSLMISLLSCHREDDLVTAKGRVAFGVSPVANSGGRLSETSEPAFVLVSIKNSKGEVQENIKLSLVLFGTGYLSDNLELPTGIYQLTQFIVLNGSNEAVYATPMAGSTLAKFVSNPLPLEFTVSEEGTEVTPQVLAVGPTETPASFGYANFQFEVIEVGAFTIPLTDAEQIVKVSYEFVNGTQTISADVTPSSSSFDITDADLLGKTWQTRILAWASTSDCYQKVYRFKGQLSFKGTVIELPSLNDKQWTPFYYTEQITTPNNKKIGIFRSADPRKSFIVEVQLPPGICSQSGYVDKGYWNAAGEALCSDMLEFSATTGCGRIETRVPDQACSSAESYYQIDSFLTLNISTVGNSELVEDYFVWEVNDGIIAPAPCPSSGRISSNRIQGSDIFPRQHH